MLLSLKDELLFIYICFDLICDHLEQLEVSIQCAANKGTLKINFFGCIEYIATNIDNTEQELYVAYNDKLENGDDVKYGDSTISASVFLNGKKLSHSTEQTCTKVKSASEFPFFISLFRTQAKRISKSSKKVRSSVI